MTSASRRLSASRRVLAEAPMTACPQCQDVLAGPWPTEGTLRVSALFFCLCLSRRSVPARLDTSGRPRCSSGGRRCRPARSAEYDISGR